MEETGVTKENIDLRQENSVAIIVNWDSSRTHCAVILIHNRSDHLRWTDLNYFHHSDTEAQRRLDNFMNVSLLIWRILIKWILYGFAWTGFSFFTLSVGEIRKPIQVQITKNSKFSTCILVIPIKITHRNFLTRLELRVDKSSCFLRPVNKS